MDNFFVRTFIKNPIGLIILGIVIFLSAGGLKGDPSSIIGIVIAIIGIVWLVIRRRKTSNTSSSSGSSTSAYTAMDYNNSGSQNAMNGNFTAAISNYTEAMKLGLNDAQIYCSRGNCYYQAGNPTQAMQDWEKALSINPSLQEARNNLQAAKANLGKND
jgi:tetratricopeptide (TPR) repeat protein